MTDPRPNKDGISITAKFAEARQREVQEHFEAAVKSGSVKIRKMTEEERKTGVINIRTKPQRNFGDRTVHAEYPGMEIVRYERAKKWYLEPRDKSLARQLVTIVEAVDQAVWGVNNGGRVYFNRRGGAAFEKKVKGALNAKTVSAA